MAFLLTERAYAYVNLGRWVADCPRPDCGGAMELTPRQTSFHCGGMGGCKLITEVVWPDDADEIWRVLEMRPVANTRNWAPEGHRQALACHMPGGQTVADLIDENREHGVS